MKSCVLNQNIWSHRCLSVMQMVLKALCEWLRAA